MYLFQFSCVFIAGDRALRRSKVLWLAASQLSHGIGQKLLQRTRNKGDGEPFQKDHTHSCHIPLYSTLWPHTQMPFSFILISKKCSQLTWCYNSGFNPKAPTTFSQRKMTRHLTWFLHSPASPVSLQDEHSSPWKPHVWTPSSCNLRLNDRFSHSLLTKLLLQ